MDVLQRENRFESNLGGNNRKCDILTSLDVTSSFFLDRDFSKFGR